MAKDTIITCDICKNVIGRVNYISDGRVNLNIDMGGSHRRTMKIEDMCLSCSTIIAEMIGDLQKSKTVQEKKFECYEIHTVQARMYGCTTQCEECKQEQLKSEKQ